MSDYSERRRRPVRGGRLSAVGLAGVAATIAIASLATPNASAATDFGIQKIRVGVQIKDGAFVPVGTTTANTEATITETGPNAPDPGVSTCNTDAATAGPGSTATYCIFGADEFYSAQPGDTVTVTQSTVNDNLVIDSSTETFGPCFLASDEVTGVCTEGQTALFSDPGVPPTTQDDHGTVTSGGTIVIDVTANDSSNGAATTIAIDTPAAHGTATPIPSSSAASAQALAAAGVAASSIRYTSDTGFSGHDQFTYTLTDANGSSTASVFLTVVAAALTPPTAVNDTATTVSGRPVTIHVQLNDQPNGSGALHLTAVGNPSHGTATIDGTSIVYRPASGFSGVDHFAYTTANSGGTATAQVIVTVTAPLADTGAPSRSLIAIALGLIAGGSLLAEIGRRQRRGHHRAHS